MVTQKICLFMPTLGGGGAERVMLNLSEKFIRAGIDVDLVVANAKGALSTDVPSGVRVVDFAVPRLIRSVVPLALYLRRARPQAILSAMIDANCVALWARALSGTNPRIVVSEHSALSVATANETTVRKKLLPFFARLTYPRADEVLAVSAGVADDLAITIGLPRHRIQVIYNPVITPDMLEKSREPVNHPWFAPGQPPVVLGVGRLTAPKDFKNLLRAFALLRQERQLRLVILGEGEQRETLTKLIDELGIKDDVALPGFVRNPYQFMRASKVFALSSRWEGLSNVLIEALACGANVVSTDCPSGPAEILEHGKWGRLVPVGRPDLLAVAIAEALEKHDFAPGLRSALRRFEATTVSIQYLRVLMPNTRIIGKSAVSR